MVEKEALKRVRKVKQPKEDDRRVRYLWNEECRPLVEAPATEGAHETSTMSHSYTKPAGISLLAHIILLCLALLLTGQAAVISCPRPSPHRNTRSTLPAHRYGERHAAHYVGLSAPPAGSEAQDKDGARLLSPNPHPPSRHRLHPLQTRSAPSPLPGEVNATSVPGPLPGDRRQQGAEQDQAPGKRHPVRGKRSRW